MNRFGKGYFKVIKFIIVDIGGIVLLGVIFSVYLVNIFSSDIKRFIEYVAPLFAGMATLCGLTLGFASIMVESPEKTIIAKSSEKLLHATLFFTFASLFGLASFQAEIIIKYKEVANATAYILKSFGIVFLWLSFSALHFGVMWLSDTLWYRCFPKE